MIKAIIFDMDGVLVDSEPLSIQIGIEFFESKGFKICEKDFEPFLGGGEKLFFTGPASKLNFDIDLEEASAFFIDSYRKKIKANNIVFDNAVKLLKGLIGVGYKVAIASSAPREKIYLNLGALGLEPSFFDVVTVGEDIIRNKPEPDIYSLTAIKLGEDASSCLVFEDSINGIKSAKRAGMQVVGLMTTENGGVVASAGADVVISSLAAIPSFKTKDEFFEYLFEDDNEEERVMYGANLITPLKTRFAEEFITRRMIDMAMKTREHAYTPFSGFKVGAALLSARTGKIYTGCNVENSSYGATICAERNAVLHAIAEEGVIGVERLVVVTQSNPPSPPCAMCLQVLAEFTKSDTPIILVDLKGNRTVFKFRELLPNPFYLKQV